MDGPCSGVPRQARRFTEMHLTSIVTKIPRGASERTLRVAWEADKVNEKWNASSWARRIEKRNKVTIQFKLPFPVFLKWCCNLRLRLDSAGHCLRPYGRSCSMLIKCYLILLSYLPFTFLVGFIFKKNLFLSCRGPILPILKGSRWRRLSKLATSWSVPLSSPFVRRAPRPTRNQGNVSTNCALNPKLLPSPSPRRPRLKMFPLCVKWINYTGKCELFVFINT